jgi:hypothetical protein
MAGSFVWSVAVHRQPKVLQHQHQPLLVPPLAQAVVLIYLLLRSSVPNVEPSLEEVLSQQPLAAGLVTLAVQLVLDVEIPLTDIF